MVARMRVRTPAVKVQSCRSRYMSQPGPPARVAPWSHDSGVAPPVREHRRAYRGARTSAPAVDRLAASHSDVAGSLHRKYEPRGRGAVPGVVALGALEGVERPVDLHGREVLRAELELPPVGSPAGYHTPRQGA